MHKYDSWYKGNVIKAKKNGIILQVTEKIVSLPTETIELCYDEYTGDDKTNCRILQDTARFEGLALWLFRQRRRNVIQRRGHPRKIRQNNISYRFVSIYAYAS